MISFKTSTFLWVLEYGSIFSTGNRRNITKRPSPQVTVSEKLKEPVSRSEKRSRSYESCPAQENGESEKNMYTTAFSAQGHDMIRIL